MANKLLTQHIPQERDHRVSACRVVSNGESTVKPIMIVILLFIYASAAFKLSFDVYFSLKQQECTKQIRKIPEFTLHVLHFTTFLATAKCIKQSAISSKRRFSFAV